MGFIDKIRDITRGYEEEPSQQEEIQEGNTVHSAVSQSAPQFPYDGNNNGYANDYSSNRPSLSKTSRILNIPATTTIKFVILRPEKYEEAGEIANHFKNKKAVLLNLEQMSDKDITRLIDFLAGVAYVTDGRLKRVANMAYILVPMNVEISGDMIDELGNNI